MNSFWEEYISKINQERKELPADIRSQFTYDDSAIQERIMRLWSEARAFELIQPEYRDVALWTLKKDFITKHQNEIS